MVGLGFRSEWRSLFRRRGILREAPLQDQIQMDAPPTDASTEPRQTRRRTVGQLLRETREGIGSDLNRVATALRIRAAYLEAIEEGR